MSTVAASELRTPLRPTHSAATALAASATGAGFLAVSAPSALGLVEALFAGLLVWLAALDLEYRLLPNRIVLPATAAVLAAVAVLEPSQLPEHALAAVGAGGFLLVAASLRAGALGMGDVKLALLVGATLGGSVMTALMLGFGLVGLVGLGLVARDGRAALKRELPLGPFLAFGAIVALLAS
jgi:leader peptidase (prepilin peptidase)/N-methyltransferase